MTLLVQHFLPCEGTLQCSAIVSMDMKLLVQHFLPCVGMDTVFYNSEYGRGTISTTLSPLCRHVFSVLQ